MMAVEARIETLEQRHEQLESELVDTIAHPGSSDAEIAAIKRQKLQIKDAIEKLKADTALH